MSEVLNILTQRFQTALAAAFGDDYAQADPMIRPSGNANFGDYQANFAMSLARTAGKKPREMAEAVCAALDAGDICAKTEIAGPGFINITLAESFVDQQIGTLAGDERLGVQPAEQPQNVVVDYSSPNVAKEMHIGHLRSTIIGDAIARVLGILGHHVIRQNHIGDWGTQFGMLIENMVDGEVVHEKQMQDLNALYQQSKKRFDAEEEFAARARRRVVALQSGDQTTLGHWRQLVDASTRYFQSVYGRMNVLLGPGDIRGESFYNDQLPVIVDALKQAGLLTESDGAKVVFPEGFKNKEGDPLPMIVQKRDGGFLYATTDLAAARYRINELHADRIIYVTDSRQSDHFAMVFWTIHKADWQDNVRLDHVAFGTILGKDRKPFKTREGTTVRLVDVLDEAEQRAAKVIEEKNPDLPADQKQHIAQAVGLGALKYGDLSSDRIKDYIFDWDRMLSFEGNTAPYLQNAYVRIRSIFRKGEVDEADLAQGELHISEPAERALALKLFQFSDVVNSVSESLEPHRLCTYLYELATVYHKFYENCPVLRAEDETIRATRLRLCHLTGRTLQSGLELLGIETVEQM